MEILLSTDDLLALMACVLCMGGQWHARARGATVYCVGATPREAMLLAVALDADLF